MARVIRGIGHDSATLLREAGNTAVTAAYRSYTNQAIAAGVFGSPSDVFNGELFWGQDPLEFLDEALATHSNLRGHL